MDLLWLPSFGIVLFVFLDLSVYSPLMELLFSIHVWKLLEDYDIDHVCQALNALKRHCLVILADWYVRNLNDWTNFLSFVLWAYVPWSAHKPRLSLFYGVKAMVLIKIMVPSSRLTLANKLSNLRDSNYNLEVLDERRYNAESKWLSYKKYQQNPITKE